VTIDSQAEQAATRQRQQRQQHQPQQKQQQKQQQRKLLCAAGLRTFAALRASLALGIKKRIVMRLAKFLWIPQSLATKQLHLPQQLQQLQDGDAGRCCWPLLLAAHPY